MVTDDLRTDLHDSVDKVVSDKEKEDADNDRIASLETRLSAAENRETPGVDLSPIHGAISGLNDKFDTLLAAITATGASRAEGSTQTTADVDPGNDEDDEPAPKVVTQMATRAEVTERPPRAAHFLFRRLGGR